MVGSANLDASSLLARRSQRVDQTMPLPAADGYAGANWRQHQRVTPQVLERRHAARARCLSYRVPMGVANRKIVRVLSAGAQSAGRNFRGQPVQQLALRASSAKISTASFFTRTAYFVTQPTHALALTNNQLATAVSNPGSLGTIDAYISAVYRIPMLTPEQEVELGERLRDHGDLDAARQLILSHLRLVVSISRQYLGYGLAHADLIQEGNIGLMKAVRRFDPSRGVRLVSFAVHWIRPKFTVHHSLASGQGSHRKAQRSCFNLRRLTPGQTYAEDVEVRSNNVRPQDVSEMEVRMSDDMAFDVPSKMRTSAYFLLSDEAATNLQVLQRRATTCRNGRKTPWQTLIRAPALFRHAGCRTTVAPPL